MNTNLQVGMDEFNRLTREIVSLNKPILAAEFSQTRATLSGGTGMNFFQDFLTSPSVPNAADFEGAAAYISLRSDVLGNPEDIAAGGVSGAPGDNENALNIAPAIQTDESLTIRKWTIEDRGRTVTSSLETGTLDGY
jgi:hypothetical protein